MRTKIEKLSFSVDENKIYIGGKERKVYVAKSAFRTHEASTLALLYELCRK